MGQHIPAEIVLVPAAGDRSLVFLALFLSAQLTFRLELCAQCSQEIREAERRFGEST